MAVNGHVNHGHVNHFAILARSHYGLYQYALCIGDQEEMTDNPVLTFGPGPPIITNEEVRGPKGSNLFVFHLPNETTNW